MGLKNHDSPNKITEDAIREAFTNADSISFAARNWNVVEYRWIAFGNFDWLPLKYVLSIVDITPQMLKPVFNPQREVVPNSNEVESDAESTSSRIAWVDLPESIDTYEQLGAFPGTDERFRELARIFGKTIEVWKEDDNVGTRKHIFTVYTSGAIILVLENS